jgi:hypothetical protein
VNIMQPTHDDIDKDGTQEEENLPEILPMFW